LSVMKYGSLVNKLSGETRVRVGVYICGEEGESPIDAWRTALGPDIACIEAIDREFLTSGDLVDQKLLDVLVVPDLAKVPADYFLHVEHFFIRGGKLIIGSSDYLSQEMPFASFVTGDKSRVDEVEMYTRTSALLGIKPYVSDVEPVQLVVEKRFLPSLPRLIPHYHNKAGLYLNNSARKPHPAPRYGSVFSERTPDANVTVLACGQAADGTDLTSAVVMSQRWRSGAVVIAVAGAGDDSLLDPLSTFGSLFLKDAVRLAVAPVRITGVSSDFPVYRDAETPVVSCTVNTSSRIRADIFVTVSHGEKPVWQKRELVNLEPEISFRGQWTVPRKHLKGDVFTILVSVSDSRGILAEEKNGFIIWDEGVARNGPEVELEGSYFKLNGRGRAINGVNYYESHLGETMWVLPNIASLAEDFSKMEASCVNYVRIHYHHPAWFLDHFESIGDEIPAAYRHLPRTPIAPEYYWRVLDAHIYLCQKHGIIFGSDLFTLVGRAMGDPRGWCWQVQDVIQSADKRRCQVEFIAKLAERYRNLPAIAWDLWNEPSVSEEQLPLLLDWATEIRHAFRASGDQHPISIGSFHPAWFDSVSDFYAGHGHALTLSELAASTRKPQIFQEVWMDRYPTPQGEKVQRNDMMNALVSTYARGFAGFSPWQWTQQARLWNHFLVTQWELWDDWLGCCRRNDGSEKPAGRFYRMFCQLVSRLDFQRFDSEKNAIQTDQGLLEFKVAGKAPFPSMTLMSPQGAVSGFGFGRISIKEYLAVETAPTCLVWYHLDDSDGRRILSLNIDGDSEVWISGAEIAEMFLCNSPFPNRKTAGLDLKMTFAKEKGYQFNHPARLSQFWLQLSLK